MSPAFSDGERVFAMARRRYRTGDVIVFRTPGLAPVVGGPAWRIKRIAAVAGEPTPRWLGDCGWSPASAADQVPVDHLVVVGDNQRSEDSRHYGFIPVTAVAGRVMPGRCSVVR